MERLTERDTNGTAMAACCGENCKHNFCCENGGFAECGDMDDIIDRLAAYEDIMGDDYDLDRLKVLVNQQMTMREEVADRFRITKDIPVDRLQELVEADRDGRCVVLPCKVGDKIYKLFCGEVVELDVERIVCWVKGNWKLNANTDKKYRDWKGFEIDFSDFGKTVFLTCEAAEAALKGEQHDNSL